MKAVTLSIPELGMVIGTRAMIGAGVALLASTRLDPGQRKAVGWTLVGVGAFTTIPLALELFFSGRLSDLKTVFLGEPRDARETRDEGARDGALTHAGQR